MSDRPERRDDDAAAEGPRQDGHPVGGRDPRARNPDRDRPIHEGKTTRIEPQAFDDEAVPSDRTMRVDSESIRRAMDHDLPERAPRDEAGETMGWAPAVSPRRAADEPDPDAEERPFPPIIDAGTPETESLKAAVVAMMKTVYDPEIPVNIYEMGMVYDVAIDQAGRCLVTMTLTSPSCPVAGTLPGEVEAKIGGVDGVAEARVTLVWDPPWTPDMMSEAARLDLNMM